MNITLNNYEACLMDYLDGKLNAAEEQEVLLFLEQHPHIREEFEGLASISVSENNAPFDASFLMKPQYAEVKHTYEPLLVAQLEGDLTLADEYILQQGFAHYPELRTDEKLFALTRLFPDLSVVFPNKQQLRRGNVFVLHRQTLLRIAAVLLFLGAIGIIRVQFDKTPALVSDNNVRPVAQKPKTAAPQIKVFTQEPSQQMSTTNESQHNIQQQIQFNQPLTVASIEPPEMQLTEREQSLDIPALRHSNAWLSYTQPAQAAKSDEYVPLQALLKNKTRETLKDAGVTFQKDDSTGRITGFAIAALGLEWSQTK